jgi:hypothetical protein
MNSYTKSFTFFLVAGILFGGLIALAQTQPTSAQSNGFSGIQNIPDLIKRFIGEGDSNNNPGSASADYLDIDRAVIAKDPKKLQAVLQTHGHIPKDGSGGAFGYGILTEDGEFNAVMVSTTHKGVKDSIKQNNKNDPVWHNHYISLDTKNPLCADSPAAVKDITFQSPGSIVVNKDRAVMSNMPATFTGTDALTGKKLTLSPGTDVDNVVSFTLDPKFDEKKELKAVCVNDIRNADRIIGN